MSEDNKYFKEALQNFAFDVASGDAIRHLTDLGMTAEEISDKLDFPMPLTYIKKVMDEHLEKKAGLAAGKDSYEYVKEQDEYGHTSFKRIKSDGTK